MGTADAVPGGVAVGSSYQQSGPYGFGQVTPAYPSATDLQRPDDVWGDLNRVFVLGELGFMFLFILGLILMVADGGGMGIAETVIAIFFLLAASATKKAQGSDYNGPDFVKFVKRAWGLTLGTTVLITLYFFVFVALVISWGGEGGWAVFIFIILWALCWMMLKRLGPVRRYAKALSARAPPV
jgi:hypothetical protein